jgi:hypothetical protein
MKCRVRATLFLPGRTEEVDAVLSNEERADHEPVLLVDGEPTSFRYEVVRLL